MGASKWLVGVATLILDRRVRRAEVDARNQSPGRARVSQRPGNRPHAGHQGFYLVREIRRSVAQGRVRHDQDDDHGQPAGVSMGAARSAGGVDAVSRSRTTSISATRCGPRPRNRWTRARCWTGPSKWRGCWSPANTRESRRRSQMESTMPALPETPKSKARSTKQIQMKKIQMSQTRLIS